MWGKRHLAMLAIVRVGEQPRDLARNWSSGNSEGSSRELAANKIRLPDMYKNSRANKTFSSLSPQPGFACKAIFVRCNTDSSLCHTGLSSSSRDLANGFTHARFASCHT